MFLRSTQLVSFFFLMSFSPLWAAKVEKAILTAMSPSDIKNFGCTAPPDRDGFTLHDRQVVLWFSVSGMNPDDRMEATWRRPDGQVYKTSAWPKGKSGAGCYWAWIEVYSAKPFATPGDWSVSLAINGVRQFGRTIPLRSLGNTPGELTWKVSRGNSCPPDLLDAASARTISLPEVDTFTTDNRPVEHCYYTDVPLITTGIPVYLYLSTDDLADIYVNGARMTSIRSADDPSGRSGCLNGGGCEIDYRVGEFQLPPSMLINGTNQLAIRVINTGGGSYFGAALSTVSPPRQLVIDDGFEEGLRYWNVPFANDPVVSTDLRTHGRQSACLGTPSGQSAPAGSSAINQRIAIPADAPFVQLKFSYFPWSDDSIVSQDRQEVVVYDQERVPRVLFSTLSDSRRWTRANLDLSEFRGQDILLMFRVNQDASERRTGMCLDDVSLVSGPESVFIVHGIDQKGGENGELQPLLEALRNPITGLGPPRRFVVDGGFSLECASKNAVPNCGKDCTIENGAKLLASYVKRRTAAVGDINMIGYSMGGLLARDMLEEHMEELGGRISNILATLGTPHLGYSYSGIDELFKCDALIREMFGDFTSAPDPSPDLQQTWLTFNDGTSMAISQKLADLYDKWQQPMFDGKPIEWYALAGSYCDVSTRLTGHGGCPGGSTNDGVVCTPSATMAVPSSFPPTEAMEFPKAAHIDKNVGTWGMYCATPDWTYPLYAPPADSDLFAKLKWRLMQWVNDSAPTPPSSSLPGNPPGTGSAAGSLAASLGGGVQLEFVPIPAGEFVMGCSPGDTECRSWESPRHSVRITKSFEMGRYEVTQAQWEAVMGNNPARFKGATLPAEQVTWNDIQQFLARLNGRNDGYRYRLPSEAEWEYAARAGTTDKYAGGVLDEIAWYLANSGLKTHPVGEKKPNAWGLYDMLGNVYEWCQDWNSTDYYSVSPGVDPTGPSSGGYKTLRGGAWGTSREGVRVSDRADSTPGYRWDPYGFRCVREK